MTTNKHGLGKKLIQLVPVIVYKGEFFPVPLYQCTFLSDIPDLVNTTNLAMFHDYVSNLTLRIKARDGF